MGFCWATSPVVAGVIQTRKWRLSRVFVGFNRQYVRSAHCGEVCGFFPGDDLTRTGVIPTPALDRIAAQGLRYTNFHSMSLCSPTRAAIITGRDDHSAGFGVVALGQELRD